MSRSGFARKHTRKDTPKTWDPMTRMTVTHACRTCPGPLQVPVHMALAGAQEVATFRHDTQALEMQAARRRCLRTWAW